MQQSLQDPILKNALAQLKNHGLNTLREFAKSLELPVKRPRLALFGLALLTAVMYVLSLYFFLWFSIFFLAAADPGKIETWRRFAGIAISAFFIVGARYYFAEAERQRILAAERWIKLKIRKP